MKSKLCDFKCKLPGTYVIGLVYWNHGREEPFQQVTIRNAFNELDALSRACSVLKPHHMQTLTTISTPEQV